MFSNFVIKLYKPLGGVVFVVVFFSLYNTYLVDRSLTNFKIALEQTVDIKTAEDLGKIKSLLKIPLFAEISKLSYPVRTWFRWSWRIILLM